MGQRRLTLESLKELDFGLVAEAFQAELTHVVRDVQDRPGDDKKRKVAINFVIVPVGQQADEVEIECEVVSTVPKRVSKPYRMKVQQNSSLLFEPLTPENPDQLDVEDVREKQ